MTTTSLIVTIACGYAAVGLAFAGVYWLGMRNAYRQVSRDLMEIELQNILRQADEDDGFEEVYA